MIYDLDWFGESPLWGVRWIMISVFFLLKIGMPWLIQNSRPSKIGQTLNDMSHTAAAACSLDQTCGETPIPSNVTYRRWTPIDWVLLSMEE